MSSRLRRVSRVATIICSIVLGLSLFAQPAFAPPPRKQFTATISPTSAVAGVPTTYTLTLTNAPGSQVDLGSANVTFPASFDDLSLGAVTAPSGKTWTATLAGNAVQLRSPAPADRLTPGQAVSVVITATATSPGVKTITVLAKQSNNFLGSGNDFTISGSQPTVTVGGNATFCGGGSCTVQTSNWGSGPTASAPLAGRVSLNAQTCTDGINCYVSIQAGACGGAHGCIANQLFYSPPDNATAPVIVDYVCAQSACPGDRLLKENEDGSITILEDCPTAPPAAGDLPCVASRTRDTDGTFRAVIYVGTEDPLVRNLF